MDQIIQFFVSIWAWINELFSNALNLEGFLGGLYIQYIAPIPSFLKTGLLILAIVIFIMGIYTFIKKLLKLFIVLAIIAILIILFTR